MSENEKRQNERYDSLNLLHYKMLDAVNGQIGDGMARTLNVSEGGILVETTSRFRPGQEVSVTLGLEEEQVDVIGKVRHCKQSENGLYAVGLQFENLDATGARVLSAYLKLFKAGEE